MDPLSDYVTGLFAREDDVLVSLREEADRRGLPPISIAPDTGKLLQLLLRTISARRVLEVGTLGGYSAIWMARALPRDGHLLTIEADEMHAHFAQRFVDRAGLAGVIAIRRGRAIDQLASLDGQQFDLAFLDADKAPLPTYLEWALRLVRPGGIIVADNALWGGRVIDESVDDEATRGVRAFNARFASDPRLTSILLPMHDGIAVGVVGPTVVA